VEVANPSPWQRQSNSNRRPHDSKDRSTRDLIIQYQVSAIGPNIVTNDIDVVVNIDHFDVNVVRINIWYDNGQLTLNDKVHSLADFELCRRRWEFDWRCQGDGLNDLVGSSEAVLPSMFVLVMTRRARAARVVVGSKRLCTDVPSSNRRSLFLLSS
jgi:hypothetical protein